MRAVHQLLERDLEDYGPIISWYDDTARIVVSTDADDEATAAAELYAAVAAGMRAAGVPRYPTAVAIERPEEATTPRGGARIRAAPDALET